MGLHSHVDVILHKWKTHVMMTDKDEEQFENYSERFCLHLS